MGYNIGVFAPSLPTTGARKEAIDKAISYLAGQGHRIVLGETVLQESGYKSAPAKVRAEDLRKFLLDSDIDMIMATTGGYNSNEVLAYIDTQNLPKTEKIFVGYSDCTVLSMALQKAAICKTVQGPMLVDYLAYPQCFDDLFRAMCVEKRLLKNTETSWESRARNTFSTGQIKALPSKRTTAKGTIFGANLSTLCLGLGTPHFVDMRNVVLFLEYDREEQQALPSIERFLWQLRLSGVFEQLEALVFGRLQESVRLEETSHDSIQRILRDATEGYFFPVLYNAQFGHLYPSWVLFNGRSSVIDGMIITHY
jgi:muramoyltetrapeptide carboxypeptidase